LGGTAANAADVDVSVAIQGEILPGVYGRVDIGGRPPPMLVYASPIVIEQPAAQVIVAEPIYLHVPPQHARDWRRHCREYHACNRRVYFVRSAEYEPGYTREDEHEPREEWRRDEHDMRREEHEMRKEERERRKDHDRRDGHRDQHDGGRDHYDRERDHDHEHEHDHD
jgi:hypothetical protein